MDELEMTCETSRYSGTVNLFFKGIGNKLQYTDSCIAESVMLQFAELSNDTAIHDSFIMRQGYAGI